ncbi:hypothetical protein DPMN_087426 [Dreissena polymorpha]|uniref:Uncharacterized protein n=1 Tax=Dreissena polymorpha TaxID=45954 RepID=A0A9D4KS79_DREPO|nr:hypothetical protein DPMN_087426 [Dreissena polymorpha]
MILNCLSDLKLGCIINYVPGFKEERDIGAQFIRQYVFMGNITLFRHHQETFE